MKEARFLEILALVFGLGGVVAISVATVMGYRLSKKAHKSGSIDPRIAVGIILSGLIFGICMALAGLSLSLWSPNGLAHLSSYEMLIGLLICSGSGVLAGLFLIANTWVKFVFLKRRGVDVDEQKLVLRNRILHKNQTKAGEEK